MRVSLSRGVLKSGNSMGTSAAFAALIDRSSPRQIRSSEHEGVDALIRRDVQVPAGGDGRLKAAHLAHRFRGPAAGKDDSSRVGPKPSQPIAVLGADGPDDRIGVAVRCGDGGRTPAVRGGTPGGAEGWRRTGRNLQGDEVSAGPARTTDAGALECDQGFIRRGEVSWRGPDCIRGDPAAEETPADSSEVVTVEEIDVAVFTERDQQ